EFLLSQPVNPRAIVWGKYISATLALFLIQSLPLMGLAWLSRIGGVDLGHLGAGLFGLLLLSGALVALGLFLSSLTDSPLTALLVTWPLFILLWTAGFAQAGVGAFSEEGWARIVGLFDLQGRMSGFTQGVINFEDMVFLIAFALFWVFMTRRSLEAQGWK
ncbi:hypothetical protein H8D30_06025, partial [bacterium]|nr:hypothetical protein [bacterium]